MWKTMKQTCNLIMQPQELKLKRTVTKKMTLHKWKQKQLLQKWRWLILKCERSRKPKIITTYGRRTRGLHTKIETTKTHKFGSKV